MGQPAFRARHRAAERGSRQENRSPTHLWKEPAQAPDATAQTRPVELDERGFFDAIAAAADVLFVVAAGNGGIDVAETGLYPASFRLPNVLTVGAIDAVGDDACFTNFGEAVVIYANGCGIESDNPGGGELRFQTHPWPQRKHLISRPNFFLSIRPWTCPRLSA